MLSQPIRNRIASDLKSSPEVVAALEEHLTAGDPIPYLARRFPDKLGGLDIAGLRKMRNRIEEGRDLELRRANVLKSLEPLGDAAKSLRELAETATDKFLLEDVAAHQRKHKGTRGSEAIAKGLEPLTDLLQTGDTGDQTLDEVAAPFVNAEKGVATAHDALTGAAAILAERYAAEPLVRARVRREMRDRGEIVSKVFDATKPGADRYKEFFDKRERGKQMAGRRYLKLRQGEREKVLKFSIEIQSDAVVQDLETKFLGALAEGASENAKAKHEFRKNALKDAVSRILPGAIELDVRTEWKERSDLDTINGFLKKNIHSLCFRPAFGRRVVAGVDPAVRKGLRAAVVGVDGTFVAEATFELEGDARAASIEKAAAWLREHGVEAIAVSNDHASGESQKFFKEVVDALVKASKDPRPAAAESQAPEAEAAAAEGNGESVKTDAVKPEGAESEAGAAAEHGAEGSAVKVPEIIRVPEVGAAAIANSPLGREELGEQPVPVRTAVSMARRLQDPISEYVRVDPKVLSGFHHGLDVAKGRLDRLLTEEVETCVHEIPIDVNSASAALLSWVGGMGIENAKKIVEWRKTHGAFPSRVALALVGLDESIYKRAVAFLRVYAGADPLDATGVHPEHAPVVEKICQAAGVSSIADLTNEKLHAVSPDAISQAAAAEAPITPGLVEFVRDLLLHSRQDPRGRFVVTVHNEGVRSVNHLKPGQELEGIVRGIANFGVFVDLGVYQDGLLHVSELADHFVDDPHQVVKVGEHVKVRVLSVDPTKKKIALTMKSEEARQKAEQEKAEARAARKAAVSEARERAQERRRRQAEGPGPAHPRPEGGGTEFRAPRPARPAPAPVRAASTRRDGIAGGKRPRRGGPMEHGGRRDGRGRGPKDHDDDLLTPEQAGGVKPEGNAKPEAAAPPANPFKRFFQARGLMET